MTTRTKKYTMTVEDNIIFVNGAKVAHMTVATKRAIAEITGTKPSQFTGEDTEAKRLYRFAIDTLKSKLANATATKTVKQAEVSDRPKLSIVRAQSGIKTKLDGRRKYTVRELVTMGFKVTR